MLRKNTQQIYSACTLRSKVKIDCYSVVLVSFIKPSAYIFPAVPVLQKYGKGNI